MIYTIKECFLWGHCSFLLGPGAHKFPSTIVWPHIKHQEGKIAPPITEKWIKDLLNRALPIRTRPSFPLSLSHQKASISLLSISIRGQTQWKWQSQKTNQTSCLGNPMNRMKRQKGMTLKDELTRSVGAHYATGDHAEITPGRMKRRSQSKNNTQLWMWQVMEVSPML